MVDLKTNLGPIELSHPVINASGTFDLLKAEQSLKDDLFEKFPFAAYVPKTVTLHPRSGNLPPRLYETAAGLLNSIGLANKGIEAFIKEDLPRLAPLKAPLIASIAGEETEEYARCAALLDRRPEVNGIELNVSCPNIALNGKALGCDAKLTSEAVRLARGATSKFLIVKLTPNVTDIVAVARAAVEAGADCISVINTVHGMALDPWTLKPVLGHTAGGLSGPAIKPVALRSVFLISRDLGVPVIGMGGATTAQDVLEFMAAGAVAVALGTANFLNPLLAAGLLPRLKTLMEERGIKSCAELSGTSHTV